MTQMVDDWQLLQTAFSLYTAGKLDEAAGIYRQIVDRDPDNFYALHYLGIIEAGAGHLEQATSLIARSLAIQPQNIQFIENYAAILFQARDYEAALQTCQRGLQLNEANASLLYVSAISLFKLRRLQDSIAQFDKLLLLQPEHLAANNERSSVLSAMKKYDDALAGVEKALKFEPRYAEAHLNKGNICSELKRWTEAIDSYDRALALKPALSDAWLGRGNVLRHFKQYDESLAAYEKMLAIDPGIASAWIGRGNAFHDLGRYDEALAAYEKALALDAKIPFAKGVLLHHKMLCCDWRGVGNLIAQINNDILSGQLSADPFGWQGIARSPRSLQLCAELYNSEKIAPSHASPATSTSTNHGKIRVGYCSGEFRSHATSYLLVGVFECHDRSQFEIYAFDNGFDDKGEIRRRISSSVNDIIDISQLSDAAAGAVIREKQIDILVDLNGYFGDMRTSLFAQRPAPVQVNYLGFPGTLGASYMDYIIADRCVIPEKDKVFYDEKVVYLPNCYQPNDRNREIASSNFTRRECELPESGFVFCCFNNYYKILPETFDLWMLILSKVDESVLWLIEDTKYAMANLRKEAAGRGVSPDRLIFAKHLPLADHLARHRLGDLFLDTLPYNAHTTASDALWAGLPVLTQIGETFPGRVAASMLQAVGLPELIARTEEDYENIAVDLAAHPDKLALIRDKLARNRLSSALFDTTRYTRHLEAAYRIMHERHRKQLPPDHLSVRA